MHLDLMRDPATVFPVVDNPEVITSLRIWHCKYKSMRRLSEFTNLTQLVIATFADDSLDIIGSMNRLQILKVLHLPKISTLAPLRFSKCIESLALHTLPSWDSSGKVTVVDSLAPVAEMASLKHLELFGVRPVSKSLMELESSSCLLTAQFSKYPKSEIERFYKATGVRNVSISNVEF